MTKRDKAPETGVRYVIEFTDGTTKSYATGLGRHVVFKALKEQGKEYLVKRQYITGNRQGVGS